MSLEFHPAQSLPIVDVGTSLFVPPVDSNPGGEPLQTWEQYRELALPDICYSNDWTTPTYGQEDVNAYDFSSVSCAPLDLITSTVQHDTHGSQHPCDQPATGLYVPPQSHEWFYASARSQYITSTQFWPTPQPLAPSPAPSGSSLHTSFASSNMFDPMGPLSPLTSLPSIGTPEPVSALTPPNIDSRECSCGVTHAWKHGQISFDELAVSRPLEGLDAPWMCPWPAAHGGTCGALVENSKKGIKHHLACAHGISKSTKARIRCLVPGCNNPNDLQASSMGNHMADKHSESEIRECSHCLQVFSRDYCCRRHINTADGQRICKHNRARHLQSVVHHHKDPVRNKIWYPKPAGSRGAGEGRKCHRLNKPSMSASTSAYTSSRADAPADDDEFVPEDLFAFSLPPLFSGALDQSSTVVRNTRRSSRYDPMGRS